MYQKHEPPFTRQHSCIDVLSCLIHQTRIISPAVYHFSFLLPPIILPSFTTLPCTFLLIRAVNYYFSFLLYFSFCTFNVPLLLRPSTIPPPYITCFPGSLPFITHFIAMQSLPSGTFASSKLYLEFVVCFALFLILASFKFNLVLPS